MSQTQHRTVASIVARRARTMRYADALHDAGYYKMAVIQYAQARSYTEVLCRLWDRFCAHGGCPRIRIMPDGHLSMGVDPGEVWAAFLMEAS